MIRCDLTILRQKLLAQNVALLSQACQPLSTLIHTSTIADSLYLAIPGSDSFFWILANGSCWNNNRQLCGTVQEERKDDSYKFFWNGSVLSKLVACVPPDYGYCCVDIWGMNDRGDVFGTTRVTGSVTEATVWFGGGNPIRLTNLPEYPAETDVRVYAANNVGDLIGGMEEIFLGGENQPTPRAILWRGVSEPVDLGVPVHAYSDITTAYDINDSLQVTVKVVISVDDELVSHPFIWDNGTWTDLKTNCTNLYQEYDSIFYPTHINNEDLVAGFSWSGFGTTRKAFLWSEGTMYCLDDVVVNIDELPGDTSGYPKLQSVIDMNESGDMLVSGTTNFYLKRLSSILEEGMVVNSTGDGTDNDPGDGVCKTGGPLIDGVPECTLRAAIMEANATHGVDRITFAIPASSPHYESATRAFRIRPQRPNALPEITQPVIIDATTQTVPGAAMPATPRPTVILDGFDLGIANNSFHGLNISAGDSEVHGLAIVKFFGHGLYLHGSGNNKIQGNYIGIAPGATTFVDGGNGTDGVRIEGIVNNLLGGLSDTNRNVISNNGLGSTSGSNVHIMQATARDNIIIGNYIGTGDDGQTEVAGNGNGVYIDGAPGNDVESNVISGNLWGIRIHGAEVGENNVTGNIIGLGADGSLVIANSVGGIQIDSASYNTIGGSTTTPGTTPSNVISGNGSQVRDGHGISITASETKHNYILGNLIGTDQTGRLPRGNAGAGVHIDLADSNEIGGPDPQDYNVIADNDLSGIVIASSDTRIVGNNIGTNLDGDAALGNKENGLTINDGSSNVIQSNLVSANDGDGILIDGAQASLNTILGNTIGLDQTETNVLGNVGSGVAIGGGHENRIELNIVSANQGSGVALSDSASNNTIVDNTIGADWAGTLARANGENGIVIDNSPSNLVRDNMISGNTLDGIRIEGQVSRGNTVESNMVGVTADGLDPLGNGENGIIMNDAPECWIEDNVVAANGKNGIYLLLDATNTTLLKNIVGLNIDQSQHIGNMEDGIFALFTERTIIQENVIAANTVNGITISNYGTVTQDTLWLNSIFDNGDNGIQVTGGTENSIRWNRIYRNGLLGIDLDGLGVTPNDNLDWDSGPNNLQIHPVLNAAIGDTLSATVSLIGYLQSIPSRTFEIDLFKNTECDVSGYGEGRIYLKTFEVTTDASGYGRFKNTFPLPLDNRWITATATDEQGNSSEFSNCAYIYLNGQLVIVNSTGDAGDISPGDGFCSTGNVNSELEIECTLRAAIEEINALFGSQTVFFDIPDDTLHTITPTTDLPDIDGPAELDATTQMGFTGTPVVGIDGSASSAPDGLTLSGDAVTIRGLVINQFNGNGIVAGGGGAHQFEQNYIGTDFTGTLDLGNLGHGIWLSNGDNNQIGGAEADQANLITFNGKDGVHISAGRANAIWRNAIHSNANLGINLLGGDETAEGVTANDSDDSDTGPNDLQNHVTLDSVIVDDDQLMIEGSFTGSAGNIYRVELFGNDECDPSGYGEGDHYLGTFEITPDSEEFAFSTTLPLEGESAGNFVTATISDADQNTSEFSPCVAVELAPLVLKLGILRNPFLDQFLDIYMVTSAEVDSTSVTLTVGEKAVPMSRIDDAAHLWKGDYALSGNGTLLIEVCATSWTGNADCTSTSIAALFAFKGMPLTMQSADKRFEVRISGLDVTTDGFVLIIPAAESGSSPIVVKNHLSVPGEPDSASDDLVAAYTISAVNPSVNGVITVEFCVTDLPLPSGTDKSQLFIHHADAGDLVTIVDQSNGMIRATGAQWGTFELRIAEAGMSEIADRSYLRLDPSYPNPFNPFTTVQFELQTPQMVRLTIHDLQGRRVARLIDEVVPAGVQRFTWNTRSDAGVELSSGVYSIHLSTRENTVTRKLVLIR